VPPPARVPENERFASAIASTPMLNVVYRGAATELLERWWARS
jgi:hypothetical protein